MKVATVVILVLLIIAGLLNACGPSEEDLSATATQIAASIFSTQTAEAPTPTPVPTETPTPEPTPTPTSTPTPTATPEPPDPAEILETALDALEMVESYRLVSEAEMSLSLMGMSIDFTMVSDLVRQFPDRGQGVVTVDVLGETQVMETVIIGDTRYTTDPDTGEWVSETDPLAVRDLQGVELFGTEVQDLTLVGEETLDSQQVYYLHAVKNDLDEMLDTLLPLEMMDELTASGLTLDVEGEYQIEYWINKEDGRLVKTSAAGEIEVVVTDPSGVEDPVEMLIVLDSTTDYSEYDEPVQIEAPIAPAVTRSSTAVPDPSKVCVVLDTGGENDRSFNELTLRGAQEAAAAEELEFAYVVSERETDYEDHIYSFINEGCGLIVTVGFLMGDVTAAAARFNPDVHFAIVDVSYSPGFGCDENLSDCYEEDLSNLTSLMFDEYEAGYLVGVLAGCMSESAVIGSVSGMEIPPVVNFVVGYQSGALSQNPDIEALNAYIPDFNDPSTGKLAGQSMIADGADVIFGVGGNTGNGGVLAAHEAGLWGIGVDVDQYFTYPDVAPSLLSSAIKQIDVLVHDAVVAFSNDNLPAGIMLGTVANDGVGLAPYHDQEDNIPQVCKAAVEDAREELAAEQ